MHSLQIKSLPCGDPQANRQQSPHSDLGYIDDSVVTALLYRLGRLRHSGKQGTAGSAADECDYAGWSALMHPERLRPGRF